MKDRNSVSQYIQYGCGLSAPDGWINFDASPTLRIQKIPLLGLMMAPFLSVKFPRNVRYGDVLRGLPGIKSNSCKGVYCSHVLEHLSLEDMRLALRTSFDILEDGGVFRLVLPDLSVYARNYIAALDSGNKESSIDFMKVSLLGVEKRKKGLRGITEYLFSNKHHLWMWDSLSMEKELRDVGFSTIRSCKFNDSKDEMFRLVEAEGRFREAIALEAIK